MRSFKHYDTELGTQFHYQASRILGRDTWVVVEPFVYNISQNKYVCVPTGFLTDGASLPRPLWSFVAPWGNHGQAAVMHDYLCEHGRISNGTSYESITRLAADRLFFDGLTALNVNPIKRAFLYTGVNLYRTVVKPITPNKPDLKTKVESLIMEQYRKTGKFKLTDKQVALLELYKQLGK